MAEDTVEIQHGEKSIQGCVTSPGVDKGLHVGIILTHGAGGDLKTPQLQFLSEFLSDQGFLVLRFTCKSLNIVYRKRVYRSVLNWLYGRRKDYDITCCFIGGRSMGSRAAVLCSNEIDDDRELQQFVGGVICLAYPLHPVSQQQQLRSQPLLEMSVPCLFISGDQDEMARKDLMEDTITHMKAPVSIHWLEGADHSHHVKGRKREDINQQIGAWTTDWILKTTEKRKTLGLKAKDFKVKSMVVEDSSGNTANNVQSNEVKTLKRKGSSKSGSVVKKKR